MFRSVLNSCGESHIAFDIGRIGLRWNANIINHILLRGQFKWYDGLTCDAYIRRTPIYLGENVIRHPQPQPHPNPHPKPNPNPHPTPQPHPQPKTKS